MRSSRVTLRPGDEKTSNRLCVTTTAPLFDRFLRRLFGAVGDNEKSPLLEADHDPVLTLDDAESTSDGILPVPELNEPLAAAILPARGHHHRPDPERRALRGGRV